MWLTLHLTFPQKRLGVQGPEKASLSPCLEGPHGVGPIVQAQGSHQRGKQFHLDGFSLSL